MKWLLVIAVLVSSVFSTSFAQTRNYSDMADSVYAALQKHDPAFILPLLHDSCVISNLPRGVNARMIPLLLAKYPAVQASGIATINKEKNGTRITMEVMYETRQEAYPDFLVNEQGLITELNVVKSAALNQRRVGMRTLTAPDTVVLPLMIIQGRLYLKAEADGRKGIFLLDTGSPDMILNRTYFNDSLRLIAASGAESLNGVRGDGVVTRKMTSFTLGRMKLTNFSAFVMNAGIAGEVNGLPFLGAIGYNILRDFEWRFDIPATTLTLVKTDENGEYTSQQYRPATMKYLGAVTLKKQVPVIVLSIGDLSMRMGLDCSVNNCMFFENAKNDILPILEKDNPALAGQEGIPANGIQGVLPKLSLGTLAFNNLPVSIERGRFVYDEPDEAKPLHGLLGVAFLNCYKTAINLKKKLIYFQ